MVGIMLLGNTGFQWSKPLSEFDYEMLGYLMMGVGLLVVGRWVWMWRGRLLRWMEPWRVYGRVARGVGLTLGERVLLWRISRSLGLVSPITLLLSESTMRHHTDRYLGDLSARHKQVERRVVESIRMRLFEG